MRRTKNGYQTVAVGHTGEAYVHVQVAERALGRPLPVGVEVHHVNEDKADNSNQNLVICQDKAYHKLLHVRTRIVRAGGDPNRQKFCADCDLLKPLEAFNRSSANKSTGRQSVCRGCQHARWRDRQLAS